MHIRHVLDPSNDLLEGIVVVYVARERVGVHQSAKGIAKYRQLQMKPQCISRCTDRVGTVGIKLISLVRRGNVNLSLTDETRDLDVVRVLRSWALVEHRKE